MWLVRKINKFSNGYNDDLYGYFNKPVQKGCDWTTDTDDDPEVTHLLYDVYFGGMQVIEYFGLENMPYNIPIQYNIEINELV